MAGTVNHWRTYCSSCYIRFDGQNVSVEQQGNYNKECGSSTSADFSFLESARLLQESFPTVANATNLADFLQRSGINTRNNYSEFELIGISVVLIEELLPLWSMVVLVYKADYIFA